MAHYIEDEVEYYYDSHPTEEDLMGETSFHADLVDYLKHVLRWLFHGQHCAIYENLNFYQTRDRHEYPLAPDVAVIKGVDFKPTKSWRIGKDGPAPHVVFEILSAETCKKDLKDKLVSYAHMGVQEYFAYDPHEPPLRKRTAQRLFGWSLDPVEVAMRPLPVSLKRQLWSNHLDSWLAPDGTYLRLYDQHGRLRLTKEEAEEEARLAEARRADAAKRRAEEAEKRAEAERKRAEALVEKLRSLGIDPNQL